jgi:hypothetical protein
MVRVRKKSKHSTWKEDLRCGRDTARYAVAYILIIVTDVQRDLHIVSDKVSNSKSSSPAEAEAKRAGRIRGITQESSPKHGGTVGTM